MNCFRFNNGMNSTSIINTFSDNSIIANIKTKHQIMTITNRILKFKSMINKPIVADNTFSTVITFSKINPFT